MKAAAGLCSAALVLLAIAGRPGAAARADQVKVTDGIVEGVLDAFDRHSFLQGRAIRRATNW